MPFDDKAWSGLIRLIGLGSVLIFLTLALIVGLFREPPSEGKPAKGSPGDADLADWW